MKALVLVTDVPNANGRLYPRAVMEKAIAQYARKHVPVYRSLADFQAVQCDSAEREVIGTGVVTMDGTNVYADVAFHGASIQHQVLLNGLSVRTGGVGEYDERLMESFGTNAPHVVLDFQLTGLFVTDQPA